MNKTKIKYDKAKARTWFIFLKLIEFGAVLAFIFLPYWLGLYYNYLIKLNLPFLFASNPFTNVFAIWCAGWIFLINIIFNLVCILFIVVVVYIILKAFILLNWNWAKSLAEDPKEKERRLNAEKIRHRKKFGFAIGDEVVIKKNLVKGKEYGNRVKFIRYMDKYRGEKTTIRNIDRDGDFTLNIDKGEYCWAKDMLNKPKKIKWKKQKKKKKS